MPRYLKNTAGSDKRRDTARIQYVRGKNGFVDPYPWVHGTLPEKMVYAELSRLGIPFLFLNEMTFTIPELELSKEFQADFIIPAAKLIIEVQGAFWHSKEKTIQSDAYKFAIYESTGWQARAWWDYEIIDGVQDLVAKEPLLRPLMRFGTDPSRSSELPVRSRKKSDTSKGIRTLNQRRYREKAVKVSKRKLRKGIFNYGR